MMRWIFPLLLLALHAIGASAPEPEKLLESLRSALRDEVKERRAANKETDNPRNSKLFQSETLLGQIRSDEFLKDDQLSHAIQVIEQINALTLSEKVSEFCRTLLPILKERRDKRTTAWRERFDKTLRSALAAGLNAKTAKELDAPIAELAKLKKEVPVMSFDISQRSPDVLHAVEALVTGIQDVLTAVENPERPYPSSGQSLKSAPDTYYHQVRDLISRSEFVEKITAINERMEAVRLAKQAVRLGKPGTTEPPKKRLTPYDVEKQVQALVSGVNKLDDIGGVLDKLNELTTSDHQDVGNSYRGTSFSTQLASYRRIYEDLRKRAATSVRFANPKITSSASPVDTLEGVKNVLLKFALARVLVTIESLKPKSDENATEYLQRAFDTARNTSNWGLMERVLDVVETTNISKLATPNDLVALHGFLGGTNEEQAGEFSAAVTGYLSALKTGSHVIPVEKIQNLLAALKKDHPDEYVEGTEEFKSATPDKGGKKKGKKKHKKHSPPKPSTGKASDFTLLLPALTDDEVLKQRPEAKMPSKKTK